MNKERVFLIRNVAPWMFGGGETYQFKIAEKLKNYGFEPFIVSSSKELLRVAKKDGFRVIKAPYMKRQNWSGWRNALFPVYYVKILKLRRWYKKIFNDYGPSVINIQSRDDWIAATPVAKKMEIRVLWTDHMDLRSWVLTNINVWYKNWVGKWVLKCAKKVDKIIMISDYEKKSFDGLVGGDRFQNVVVIKNGVNDELEKYDDIKMVRDSFCYVGRIVDYKGIRELVEAFKGVAKKHSEARLNIYGDGDIEKYKKMSVKCENITFHGQTDEPLRALAENEIFVLPSYREGLSLSLLDAAMMKKKIVASDVDGNSEVVIEKETGLLVPARNVEKLAGVMIWVLEHKREAEEMAKKARSKYETEFDLEKIFEEKMLPLYYME